MAVKVTSSGPRGSKTYEIRVNGHLYDYTDNLADARRIAARARKEEKSGKRNPGGKTVRLRNFTGTVKLNPNKTVSVRGKAKRSNPSSKPEHTWRVFYRDGGYAGKVKAKTQAEAKRKGKYEYAGSRESVRVERER